MLDGWFVILISLGYVSLLFAIAYYGDNHAQELLASRARPWVYSLSLTIYATTWTFYGAVGRAAGSGWEFLGTYLGPILFFLVGWPLFKRIVEISKQQNITSIADFIASRYGKSQPLAVLVTCIAVLAIVPYIALQLKAVASSYNVLTESGGTSLTAGSDTALFVALIMAVFSILFGTRHIDATERHEGIVLAIAFESIVKLAAFLAVGLYVTFGIFDGFGQLFNEASIELATNENFQRNLTQNTVITEVILAAFAIICLPRQFHISVVESAEPRDLRTARWLFPTYLILASLFVLPIATAGMLSFPDGNVDADTFVLALPLWGNQPLLTLVAFIGGLSAATSMVIVATLTLSTMICNDIIMPVLLRIRWLKLSERSDLGQLLLKIRRMTIISLMLLAYFYYRILGEQESLATFGLLAFVGVAQFAPALLGAVSWKGGNRHGALAGILVGSLVWLYTLVLPSLSDASLLPHAFSDTVWSAYWLHPDALFGLRFSDSLTHSTFWSLLLNTLAYVIFSLLRQPNQLDIRQANAFVSSDTQPHKPSFDDEDRRCTFGDLQELTERFLGTERTDQAYASFFAAEQHPPMMRGDLASPELVSFCERTLAAAIGASSARILVSSIQQGQDTPLSDVVEIVDEASRVLKFNRALLQSTIENVSLGISVVDQDLRLVAWNRRYMEMFHYPESLITVGRHAEEIFRFNATMGEYSGSDVEEMVQQRLANLRSGRPHAYIRYRPDGSVFEVQGNPMPDGGYVNTYMDITEHKRTEEALRESEQSIRIYTDNVPVLIAYLDQDSCYRFVNKAYAEHFGIADRQTVIGQHCQEVIGLDEFHFLESHIQRVLLGEREHLETHHEGSKGQLSYADLTFLPHIGDNGDILGYFMLYQDITERRMAELALQETNENLENRVQERTQLISAINEELLAAKADAEAANLGKTRFLAAASHDLLQPLNAARLFTSALSQQSHEPKLTELVNHLDGSLKSAEELLVTLLDISKLDAGALEPQLSHLPLKTLFDGMRAEFNAIAEDKGLELHIRDSRMTVFTDPKLLRRVLQNFLSNAIRYTEKGKVILGCRLRPDSIVIEVWDTGVGIAPGKLEKVFEEFHRIDNPRHSEVKGLGLGLAISERISRMLGHPIEVRSWQGKGTVFSIEVPKGHAPNAEVQTPTPARLAGTGQLNGLRVLCIDNEPNILKGMSSLLQGWSCEVATAINEDECLEVLENGFTPDIILADYHLGEEATGIGALQRIEQALGHSIPSVVITADRTDAVKQEANEAGAGVLHKPMRPAALRAMINTLLSKRH